MLFAFLFMSLVPVALIADGLMFEDESDPDGVDGNGFIEDEHDVSINHDNGDFIIDNDVDNTPGDDTPDDDVLTPNRGHGDGPSPHRETTLLDELLGTETDAHYGREDLPSFLQNTTELRLGDLDDSIQLGDDGVDGTGQGAIGDFHGTPVVSGDDPVVVLDGAGGDDQLTTGDGAAYVFGNDGNDTITSGEGAMAGYGGEGDDLLDAEDALQSYLDGGEGDDTLIGGAGDDRLLGGEHEWDLDADITPNDDDLLDGGAGDDDLQGGLGADTLLGGEGDDVLNHLGHAQEDASLQRHDFDWHVDDAADSLDGGAGNDTLIMDRSDTATGGEGDDVFWLYSGIGDPETVAVITDFEPGKEVLRVTLDPEDFDGDPEYDVQPSEDGKDGIVTVNGEVVAVLEGSPDATVDDVYVEIAEEVYA